MSKVYTFKDLNFIANELKTKKKAAIVETDTVMGVVALNSDLIYTIKHRPLNKKLVSFVSSVNEIKDLTHREKKIINKYWPGPLTIVKNKLSYRIPNHTGVINLVKLTGPLFSSSANISDCDPVKDINEALQVFKENNDKIIFVQGKNLTNTPSTIIDLDQYQVIREGAISGKEILKELCQK